MVFGMYAWGNLATQGSRKYRCGYCGESVSSDRGYATGNINPPAFIYCCHECGRPTFFDQDESQTPGALFGGEIPDIDAPLVKELYGEARRCIAATAFTACVLACRKLLMHIAVAKGAKPGLKFIDYVKYLSDNHYVPPDASGWVDHIREKGNEANHEIVIMEPEDARDLVSFIEMLLTIIYAFPARIQRKRANKQTDGATAATATTTP